MVFEWHTAVNIHTTLNTNKLCVLCIQKCYYSIYIEHVLGRYGSVIMVYLIILWINNFTSKY